MHNPISRIANKVKRILAGFGLAPLNQEFIFNENPDLEFKKRILIVGAGSIPIPPIGWGAVETIISETIPHYISAGISVGLLNSHQGKQWKKAKRIEWDSIICHSDDLVKRVRKYWPNVKLISGTHYGYAAQPSKWHKSYRKVFKDLSLAEKVVCLSPAILGTFIEFFPKEDLLYAPNGSSFEPLENETSNGEIIYLGKIESRKKQYECWKSLSESGLKVKFAGPIEDSRVLAELHHEPTLNQTFPGPVSRETLVKELSKYRALLLLSDGEADALVLYEAQLAGLPIIVNKDSLGGQDGNLPWVNVINDVDEIGNALQELDSQNISKRQIASFAKENYSWAKRLKPIIEEVLEN